MKYMGSKARIAKHILPIILDGRKPDQVYVEPFCGGCNTLDKVNGNVIAADNNKYLIEMWIALQKGEVYSFDHSKSYYDEIREAYKNKDHTKYKPALIGYVGFMASANGRFFEGGYSGISKTKDGGYRNYIDEAIRNINKQIPRMQNVEFICCDYSKLIIPEDSVIYCDIPYKGTKQYSTSKDFEHSRFWGWCREQVKKGHRIFVSEYAAPDDFVLVWEKEIDSSLRANGKTTGSKKSTEKLFTYKFN